jgi:hypothetical protein
MRRKGTLTIRWNIRIGRQDLLFGRCSSRHVSHHPTCCIRPWDGRDLTAEGMDRRNVTITLRVGPKSQAYFDGIVGYGFHVRQP